MLIVHPYREEEIAFSKTLMKGIAHFKKFISALHGKKVLPGEDAFQLYDTFGFPLDLTEVSAPAAYIVQACQILAKIMAYISPAG